MDFLRRIWWSGSLYALQECCALDRRSDKLGRPSSALLTGRRIASAFQFGDGQEELQTEGIKIYFKKVFETYSPKMDESV